MKEGEIVNEIMNKKSVTKLLLAKETVRDLAGTQMRDVAAGSGPGSCWCSYTCDSGCALCTN
jgi:hypothetical protein